MAMATTLIKTSLPSKDNDADFQLCILRAIRSLTKERAYFLDRPHTVGKPRYFPNSEVGGTLNKVHASLMTV